MENYLLLAYLAGVPVLGVLAQWLAWQLRLPSILLLLVFGIVLGAWIRPDDLLAQLAGSDPSIGPKILFPIVALSVAVVLFEGGLTLRFSEIKRARNVVLRLVTVSALVSWVLTAIAASWLLGFDARIATLLGAVLVVTGPTVVVPMLRQIRPSRLLGSVVKWEGIVIDPIGAVLAVLVFEVVFEQAGDASIPTAALIIVRTVLIGLALGVTVGWLLVQLVKRFWLPDYLHGVAFLTAALGTFAISNISQHESGLVTVTVLGVYLANQKSISIRHVVEFKEHLGVLLISCLFIVLGSRLHPGDLWSFGFNGLGFLALMIFVVRPLSVMIGLLGTQMSYRERWLLAMLAPRGIVAAAVTSVFALQLAAHFSGDPDLAPFVEQANALVPATFLVIVGTVAFYGVTSAPLARLLKLADPSPQGLLIVGAEPWMRALAGLLKEVEIPVVLVDTNYSHVAAARMEGLNAECASVLSEHVREEMDLAGIGRLLALTPNDEVNALAAFEMAHHFGRQNVYRLPPYDIGSGRRQSIGPHAYGRLLFGERFHYDEIVRRFEQGYTLKRTLLTEEFDLDDFHAQHSQSAIRMFSLDPLGRLRIHTSGDEFVPGAGHAVIALVPPNGKPPK